MRRPTAAALGCLCLALCLAPAALADDGSLEQQQFDEIAWRQSIPVGAPNRGALVNGVQLPTEGANFFSFDPILQVSPNREWRRWATDTTIRSLLGVLASYRAAHPLAPRVGIADLSRRFGGPFGRRFGGLGHASHQNGLDIDIYYPREDGLELPPSSVGEIDDALARDLAQRFLRAGAIYVFVGPNTGLGRGGRQAGRKLQRLVYHDDHMHVRFRSRSGGRTG
jgi:murein endopeptidase